jgi:hypothetical protein
MPIRLHLALAYFLRTLGFLAACLTASYAMWATGTLLRFELERLGHAARLPIVLSSAAILFASAYGGVRGGNWLALRLPACCPQCGGRAWGQGCKFVVYRCERCAFEELNRTERG